MRIALSGTFGIGKSEVFNKLKEEFTSFEFVEKEVRTICNDMKIKHSCQINKAIQHEIYKRSVQTLKKDNFISDTSIIDTLAYYSVFHDMPIGIAGILSANLIIDYDVIFYFPIETENILNDNFRFTGSQSQLKIDETIRRLGKNDKRIVQVSGTLEQKLNTIRKTISDLTKK